MTRIFFLDADTLSEKAYPTPEACVASECEKDYGLNGNSVVDDEGYTIGKYVQSLELPTLYGLYVGGTQLVTSFDWDKLVGHYRVMYIKRGEVRISVASSTGEAWLLEGGNSIGFILPVEVL